jgi:hypothetical protein
MVFPNLIEAVSSFFKKKCICPKTCDCQNPPPNNWNGKSGVYHISNGCPVHNVSPDPDPDCEATVHG